MNYRRYSSFSHQICCFCRNLNLGKFLNGQMSMDIIYLRTSMTRDSSLSTWKVCLFRQLEGDNVSHPELIHLIAMCNAGQKSLGQQKRNSIKSMVIGPTSQLRHELDVSSRTRGEWYSSSSSASKSSDPWNGKEIWFWLWASFMFLFWFFSFSLH